MKSNKIITKRIKVTNGKKGPKVLRKKSSQSHYNANDTGKEKRKKRSLQQVGNKLAKKLLVLS